MPTHAIEGELRTPLHHWISDSIAEWIPNHHWAPAVLNTAMMLPNWQDEHPHNCEEILKHLTGVRDDLKHTLIPHTEFTYCTDRNSWMEKVKGLFGSYRGWGWCHLEDCFTKGHLRPAGWAGGPDTGFTSGKGKKWLTSLLTVIMHFHYPCFYPCIYKERGLLTAEWREIKNKQEILDILYVVLKSAVMEVLWKRRGPNFGLESTR